MWEIEKADLQNLSSRNRNVNSKQPLKATHGGIHRNRKWNGVSEGWVPASYTTLIIQSDLMVDAF